MSYKPVVDPELAPILDELKIKDPQAYSKLKKKIYQVAALLGDNPNHCKNLRKPLNKYKRVHVNDSFVFIFDVDKTKELMIIRDYDHHDNIYKKKKWQKK
ncbi:MAG: type II toxin-antitoxin system RelE/ParE family toxin [Methanobacteriaceae archaeon]|nr:type II toxin-antitoxin system RelE/ParE family toxin [Methanobacteriaceae archaeon]